MTGQKKQTGVKLLGIEEEDEDFRIPLILQAFKGYDYGGIFMDPIIFLKLITLADLLLINVNFSRTRFFT